MLRARSLLLDTFKEHYHRVHLPRRIALQRHVRNEERKAHKNNTAATSSSGGTVAVTQPYKYNRWWVSNDHAFVHQYAVIEDPEVTREKKSKIPTVTSENIWKEPHNPYFMPFVPFIRVVDYGKDPDAQFLKPTTVPRWKDYMFRNKPIVPRTWY
jgi:hypothetical protein